MPAKEPGPTKTLEQVVEELGLYPIEAFDFVRQGLNFTVHKIHGSRKKAAPAAPPGPDPSRHVNGQQLCEGLREFALLQWGYLARTVLARWNLKGTEDFGRIVFAMIDGQYMQKTHQDTLDDFRDIFDFTSAFENGYRIECKS